MSVQSVLDGRCRHGIPRTTTCSRCLHDAEGNVLLPQVSPYAVRKTGNQRSVSVPLELLQSIVEWMSKV